MLMLKIHNIRIADDEKSELSAMRSSDPITRDVDKCPDLEEFSPMDPPDAYAPPKSEDIAIEDMHPFLQGLMQDHRKLETDLNTFEETLNFIQEKGVDKSVNEKLTTFFHDFDEATAAHNRKEERMLFPELNKKLIEVGEHSQGDNPLTAIDMLEDDHAKAIQLAALSFNFFALSSRLPDQTSQLLVLDSAVEQGKALIELMRLHIFREDSIVFPLAHKHLEASLLDSL